MPKVNVLISFSLNFFLDIKMHLLTKALFLAAFIVIPCVNTFQNDNEDCQLQIIGHCNRELMSGIKETKNDADIMKGYCLAYQV